MNEKPVRMDPTHTAVAAILALDLAVFAGEDDSYCTAIATALEPLVDSAPPLREWDDDEQWTAAEEAVSAAKAIVTYAGMAFRDDRWKRWRSSVDRLYKMQRAHVCNLIRNRVGEFAGYQVQVRYGWGGRPLIRVFPEGVPIEGSSSILDLAADSTRRDVGIAIQYWQIGYDRGQREGAERIRRGIKNLLEVEAA